MCLPPLRQSNPSWFVAEVMIRWWQPCWATWIYRLALLRFLKRPYKKESPFFFWALSDLGFFYSFLIYCWFTRFGVCQFGFCIIFYYYLHWRFFRMFSSPLSMRVMCFFAIFFTIHGRFNHWFLFQMKLLSFLVADLIAYLFFRNSLFHVCVSPLYIVSPQLLYNMG